MTMFDPIIAEADERFNLKGKAGTLLSTLLALMVNETNGGLTGFLQKFELANLDEAVSSWINLGEIKEISGEQLESVLGIETLTRISKQIGTDYQTTVSASAFIIPRLIDALTPEGKMPPSDDLLSRIGEILNDTEQTSKAVEGINRARAATPLSDTNIKENTLNTFERNVDAHDENTTDSIKRPNNSFNFTNNSPLGWLLPLILLGLLLSIGYWFCSKAPATAAPVSENANVNAIGANSNSNAANQ